MKDHCDNFKFVANKFFSPKFIKLLVALAVCIALVFLNPRKIFDPVREIFVTVASPFQKTFYYVSEKTGNVFYLLSSISSLKSENEKLIQENGILVAQVAELIGEKKDNEDLRKQLQLLPQKDFQLESANVIAQDSQGLGSWIMMDRGSRSGIVVGMPVIVYEGILIGRVSEVYANSSRITLLTDSSSSVNATDLATGAKGILTGEYSLGITLDMVEQTEVLNVGDDIVTSGLGGGVPKGFLIGKVAQVKSSSDKLFQQALIIPKVKYADLNTVFAVKGSL